MKFPLKLLKNEFENLHGYRNHEAQSGEEFSAIIEATNLSQQHQTTSSGNTGGDSKVFVQKLSGGGFSMNHSTLPPI